MSLFDLCFLLLLTLPQSQSRVRNETLLLSEVQIIVCVVGLDLEHIEIHIAHTWTWLQFMEKSGEILC